MAAARRSSQRDSIQLVFEGEREWHQIPIVRYIYRYYSAKVLECLGESVDKRNRAIELHWCVGIGSFEEFLYICSPILQLP